MCYNPLRLFSLEVSFALCRIFHRGSLQRCNDLLDAQYFAVYWSGSTQIDHERIESSTGLKEWIQ